MVRLSFILLSVGFGFGTLFIYYFFLSYFYYYYFSSLPL